MKKGNQPKYGSRSTRVQLVRDVEDRAEKPPQLRNMGLIHNCVVRYTTAATVGDFLTPGNILDSWLVCTSSTAGYQLFDMVRIRRIEVWSPSPTVPTTVIVSFNGEALGVQGDGARHVDTSMGYKPAYVSAKPSSKCLASKFQGPSTYSIVEIDAPPGSIVDVHLSFRTMFEGLAPVSVTQALVAGQPGQVYLRGIDGRPLASTHYTPVGTAQVI